MVGLAVWEWRDWRLEIVTGQESYLVNEGIPPIRRVMGIILKYYCLGTNNNTNDDENQR